MSNPHPLEKMLSRIRQEIWERLETGKFVYERDMPNLERFLNLARNTGDPAIIAEYQLLLAVIEADLGNFDAALGHYEIIIALLMPHNDYWRIGSMLNNVGDIYRCQGRYAIARTTLEEALRYLQMSGQERGINITLSNLGLVTLALGDDLEALQWFTQSIEMAHSNSREYKIPLIESYTGIADLFLRLHDFDKASAYLRLAREWAENSEIPILQTEIYLLYARFAQIRPRLVDATPEQYYALAKSYAEKGDKRYYYARVLLAEAEYFQSLGLAAQAADSASEALTLFEQFKLTEFAAVARRILNQVQVVAG